LERRFAASTHSARIRYTDEPLGRLKVGPDFLPRPEDLVFRDEGVKVTIALSKRAEHHSRRLTTRSARTRSG